MICIKADISQEICDIDDELKAIYHSRDTVCIWVLKTREDRNRFMDKTAGMKKEEREQHFLNYVDEKGKTEQKEGVKKEKVSNAKKKKNDK